MSLRVLTTKVGVGDDEPAFTAGFVQLNEDDSWDYSPENEWMFDKEHPFRTGDEDGKAVTFEDGEVWIENLWKSGRGRFLQITHAEDIEEEVDGDAALPEG